jgi:hypothetical protein
MKVLCVSMIGSPKPTSYESPMLPDVNLEASVRSRNDQMAAGTQRDLIEAGLSEPAGWQCGYGDCVCGAGSEMPHRLRHGRIWTDGV